MTIQSVRKVWDGCYPVFCADALCWNQAMLIDVILEKKLPVDNHLPLQSAIPVHASVVLTKQLLVERVEGAMGEDGECPATLEDLIDAFIEKVKECDKPLCYWESDPLIPTETQVELLRSSVLDTTDASDGKTGK